ncbi:hypothetical protein [Streptomyces sp. BK340]|uniref:hypothetical protein n=1 Tax=Streptomyces sp. BK340 TaxID=2572903 RepID=UPI00119D9A08|nr:hypothetical protein [Streptomyces sp. BK340]TVZ76728.1 hypothetical protein FB157_1428 [Streptomyces sp. BK340]
MNVIMASLASLCGLIAAGNLVQVITGRRLIKPSASTCSVPQLRRESAVSAVVMIGTAFAVMHVFWGLLLAIPGMAWFILTRKRATTS